jgi:hypothetical protein
MWSYYGIKYKVLISIIKIFAGALRATRIGSFWINFAAVEPLQLTVPAHRMCSRLTPRESAATDGLVCSVHPASADLRWSIPAE